MPPFPPPRRVANARRRAREHLTPQEAADLIDAARHTGRHGVRDAALLLVMYRHGLRVSEAVDLRWEQVDFAGAALYVTRRKRGSPATHPMAGDELRRLRQLQREQPPGSAFVFLSERGAPLTTASVRKIVARAGELAGIPMPVHPHMLRHSTGFFLANAGHDTRLIQDYLGHRNITHTVRYTALAPGRFRGLWK